MKISFDSKRAFNNFSGLGNYSRTLIRDLERMFPNNSYTLYTPKIKECSETRYLLDSKKFKIIAPKSKLLSSLWRSWGVISDIKRDEPDIYHGLSHDLPFSVRKGGGKGTKYVVTIHDVCYKSYPDMYGFFERLIYTFKYRHSLRVADAIVAISESTKNDIIKYFPNTDISKIHTIYQALNPLYYTQIDKKEAFDIVKKRGIDGDFFLYVGSINSRKNLMGALRGYLSLPESKRKPLVVIGGGNGSYKSDVLRYIENNDLKNDIIFFSDITTSEELRAFYTAATLMVYPSFYEGFGLPVAEALLCSTPVITSSISSLPEAGGEGAYYVDPYSCQSIGDTMYEVVTNLERAQERAKIGREYILKQFEPQKLTQQMGALYKKIKDNE